MPRPRTLLVAAALWLSVHAGLWLYVAAAEPTRYPWPQDVHSLLEHWDAWHYGLISKEGYAGVRWAFYPLHPLLVGLLARLRGLGAHPEIAGTIFSTLCFAAFCLTQARLVKEGDENLRPLVPATSWGWLFLLAWPASWVFHSNHTESLFLLLSFLAFLCSRRGSWKAAALLAGLCALTRNQGVFVAAAVALDSSLRLQGDFKKRALVFAASGALSFALFALWPAYQFFAAGEWTKFLWAQSQFGPLVGSVYEFVGTVWFVNPWQHRGLWQTHLHHVAFLALNAASVALLFKREWALALYVFLSLWLPLYLGQLENAFRYGAVLFPAVFLLGDGLRRAPAPLRFVALAALVLLNLIYTRYYALGGWAY
jgi:Gpi18-like mannosyltransferase